MPNESLPNGSRQCRSFVYKKGKKMAPEIWENGLLSEFSSISFNL